MEEEDTENGGILNSTAKHYRKIVEISIWVNLVSCVILGGILGKMIYGASHSSWSHSNNDASGAVLLGIILGSFVGLYTNAIIYGLVATFLNIAEDVRWLRRISQRRIEDSNTIFTDTTSSQHRIGSNTVSTDIFTDTRDGKVYKTVKVGTQTWMAENLAYEAESSKCYGNDPANCQKYGRLYDWETAKKACPSGWHLPSKEEWEKLIIAVGGEHLAGIKLKATNDWKHSNVTNEFSFSALPGGYGNSDGGFYHVGDRGFWWSTSENDDNSAYYQFMFHDRNSASKNIDDKSSLFSVRCVMD